MSWKCDMKTDSQKDWYGLLRSPTMVEISLPCANINHEYKSRSYVIQILEIYRFFIVMHLARSYSLITNDISSTGNTSCQKFSLIFWHRNMNSPCLWENAYHKSLSHRTFLSYPLLIRRFPRLVWLQGPVPLGSKALGCRHKW